MSIVRRRKRGIRHGFTRYTDAVYHADDGILNMCASQSGTCDNARPLSEAVGMMSSLTFRQDRGIRAGFPEAVKH